MEPNNREERNDSNPDSKGSSRSAPAKGKSNVSKCLENSFQVKRDPREPCHICGAPGKGYPSHYHACFFCPTCSDYIQGNKQKRDYHLKHCGVKPSLQMQCPFCFKMYGEKNITAHVSRLHKQRLKQWHLVKDALIRDAYETAVENNNPYDNEQGTSLMHSASRPKKALKFTSLPAIELAMTKYSPEGPYHDDLSRLCSWDDYCKTELYKLHQEFLNQDEVTYAFRNFLKEKNYRFYAGPSGIVPLFNFSKHCGQRFFAFTAVSDSLRVKAKKNKPRSSSSVLKAQNPNIPSSSTQSEENYVFPPSLSQEIPSMGNTSSQHQLCTNSDFTQNEDLSHYVRIQPLNPNEMLDVVPVVSKESRVIPEAEMEEIPAEVLDEFFGNEDAFMSGPDLAQLIDQFDPDLFDTVDPRVVIPERAGTQSRESGETPMETST